MSNPNPYLTARFEEFFRIFDVDVAKTPEQKAAVHRIRYNVYCSRFGFEDHTAQAGGFETDAFDNHSVHCLVTHRQTQKPAGCVRLVTAHADAALPTEALFHDALHHRTIRTLNARRNRAAEISRLAIDTPFCRDRRRAGADASRQHIGYSRMERAIFPLISIYLFLSAGAVADLLRRTDCVALMESPLQRLLNRASIRVTPAGKSVEYRGTRTPYLLDIDDVVESMPGEMRHSYERVKDRLRPDLNFARREAAARVERDAGCFRPDRFFRRETLPFSTSPGDRPALRYPEQNPSREGVGQALFTG